MPHHHSNTAFIDPVKLERLAQIAVMVGLRLQAGQDLVITSPVTALPLARLITNYAYQAGAGLVTCFFSDEDMTLSRFIYSKEAGFDRAASWLYEGMAKAFSQGSARLAISGGNPMLLANQNTDKVARASKANALAYKPALEKITRFDINWTIVSYPDLPWAQLVFPNEDEKTALEKLAQAIFIASRVEGEDPIGDWADHNASLKKHAQWLDENNFYSLCFTGPGTNLQIGLAEGHTWKGGAGKAKNGIICNPNIPTEEVFTTPHAYRVDGFVRSTKPLSHRGSLIDGIEVSFQDGRIVQAKAQKGEDILNNILDSDEGSRRLGEVALVPHSSPISRQGLLFYNTLFDENTASHIALGQCYHDCFKESHDADEQQISKRGGNTSLIHVDWMIGSDSIDVDGMDNEGKKTPVMRKGEWTHQL